MTNEMGRPKNFTTEEIKNIIDTYVAHTKGTVILNASKIAKYANDELGLDNFKYYVINRNKDTKNYMDCLNEKIIGISEKKLISEKSIYTQLDVNKYLSMNQSELKKALINLNILFEDMANKQSDLITENVRLKNKIQQKDLEIRSVQNSFSDMDKNNKNEMTLLKENCNEQKNQIVFLNKIINEQKDLMHILWDREAETLLKQRGIFENDGSIIDVNKIITDVQKDIKKETEQVISILDKSDEDKISNKFIDRLKNL